MRSRTRRSLSALVAMLLALSLLVPMAATAQQGETWEWSNFEKEVLAQGPGEVGEPMGLAVLPDGRVLHSTRADGPADPRVNPFNPVNGLAHIYLTDPDEGGTTVAAEIPVYRFSEDGGQGIALAPDFEDSGWVYFYYFPPRHDMPESEAPRNGSGPEDFEQYQGVANLSRFQFVDGDEPYLDLNSEQVLLEVPQNLGLCCHVAGDIDFDSEGNLYLSTGDDTHFDSSSNYAPIDDRPTRNPGFDARRTSGNTAHLGGKLLRITPQPDGSYTVPEGNLFNSGVYDHLFPDGEYDEDLALPEIYAMGLRNPFRFSIDQRTDTVYLGDYGPDAGSPNPNRGPQATVSWHAITEPVNIGWPYCIGNNFAYIEYDFATGQSGDPFDCEGGPINDSRHNTGLEQLPPVTPATIWYHYGVTPEFPQLGSGGGGPMGGPAYHYDPEVFEDSDVAWPEDFDGIPLLYEWTRNFIKQIILDEDNAVVDILDTVPNIGLSQLMDMEFGPDGALYFLEYAGGFFSGSSGASLSRIVFHDGDPPPPPLTGPVGELPCIGFTSDDFEGTELNRDRWTDIVRENPAQYRVADGALHIDTGNNTDMFGGNTTAENIILQDAPAGPWQITTELNLNLTPSRMWEQAGLMIYGNDANFVKLNFIQHTQQRRLLEFTLQSGGSPIFDEPLDTTLVPSSVGDTVHIRITSNGTHVTASWSEDGNQFTEFGRERTLSSIMNPRIGVAAFNGVGTGNEASFAHFTLTPDPDELADTRSDDFDGDELDGCRWDRVTRYDPDKLEVSGGQLHLEVPNGDIFQQTNTNPDNFILQTAPWGNYVMETSFYAPFEEQYQQAGLIVYDDQANWVKLNVVTDNQPGQPRQLRLEFASEINDQISGAHHQISPAPANPDDQWWVRMQRTGSTYTGWISVDGEDWILLGQVSNNALTSPAIGIYTLGHQQTDSVTVSFDYFSVDPNHFDRHPPEPTPCGAPTIQPGYTALWNGNSLAGWSMAGPGTFDIVPDDDREGTCVLETVGGMGLLWHTEERESYRLRTDFKVFGQQDNSGIFVGFPDPGNDPWVAVDNGYEIQIDEFGAGNPPGQAVNRTGAIYSFQAASAFPTVIGEWNTYEIEVDDPWIRVWINGVLVNEFEDPPGSGRDLSSGHFGLQNHSGSSRVQFRDVQVMDLAGELAPPQATLDPSEPDGDNDWWVSPVQLTLEHEDDEVTLQWRESDGEDWTDYDAPVVFDEDGTYDLEYRASLAGGGDGTEPDSATVFAGDPEGGNIFSPDEVVIAQGGTVLFQAAGAGHDVVIADQDGNTVGAGGDFSASWTYEFTANDAGLFTFRCQPHPLMTGTLEVVGGGSASEIGEVSFRIDQTPPETEASLDGESSGGAYVGEVVLTLDAQDATSGVAETHWREVGEDHLAYEAPVVFDEPGAYAIEFRSVDVAGNVEEWQEVTFEIVEDGPPPGELELEVAASLRCVAGNVYVTVTARNDNEVPVAIEFVSQYGSRAFAAVVPDRFASHAFNTRASSVAAGSVTVHGSAVVDGVEVTVEETADFGALSCN